MRRHTWTALAVCSALALAGCSSSSGGGGTPSGAAKPQLPKLSAATALGATEGQLNLVAWAGYAEDGTTQADTDWVTPFEQKTGCQVNTKIGNTSDEMVTLMKSGQYDGVSASGDASLRMIYGGYVAPVNTDLVPNYKTIAPFLKNTAYNSVDGTAYGIPHGWGANLLMSRSDIVKPAPTSWGAVFDPNSPYKGKITAYDSPIYIADAALYLKATKPELKITNPYELDDAQFTAATDLLTQQRALVGEYWSDYLKQVSAFESGDSVLGTSWQLIANAIGADGKVKVDAVLPSEGATGWSDTWMIAAKAAHPNCMYAWMDWITSPEINAQVAAWFGEAPAQTLSCKVSSDMASHCTTYHAEDAEFASKISYWTTPTKDCGDARGVVCKDYADWTQAWTKIKG
jgi:putative spermidine/putrescine transport system substrate-binding protein